MAVGIVDVLASPTSALLQPPPKQRRGVVGEAILVYDLDGVIHDANAAACRLLGYTRRELLARLMTDLRPGVPLETLQLGWKAVMAQGVAQTPVCWTRVDGQAVVVEVTARLLQREPVRIEARAQSVSERRAAERARRERFLLRVLDMLPDDGVCVRDGEGRIVYANDSAARLCGYPTAAALCADGGAAVRDRVVVRDGTGKRLARHELPPARALQGEQPEALLHWQDTETGAERWALVRSTRMRDPVEELDLVVTVFRDITAYKQAEARYRSIFEQAREAIFRTTGRGTLETANPAAAALLGYETADELTEQVADLSGLFADARRYHDLIGLLETQGFVDDFEVELRRRDGATRWVSLRLYMHDPGNPKAGLQGTAVDITERRLAEVYRYQALHDPLTGLANRALFMKDLAQQIELAQRHRGTVAVLMVDLDRFKAINDTFGHAHGDLVLRQIGERLKLLVRQADTVARLGGDEFGLVLPGTRVTGATAIAEKLNALLRTPMDVEGAVITVGASIGIAVYPDQGLTGDSLLRRADAAMYVAKLERRGYAVSSSEPNSAE